MPLLWGTVLETLDFSRADSFNYLDYNDPDKQMAKYLEEGFPAWMRAYQAGELVVWLLLEND